LTKPSDNERYMSGTLTDMAGLTIPVDEQRCPTCRTKIVVPGEEGLVIKNAILRVNAASGQASAKCPRCKTWVDVPLTYRV
jgi:DNA-directed RNA polymerase subunit RPC12/RpoP